MKAKGLIVNILLFLAGCICGFIIFLMMTPSLIQQAIPFAIGGIAFALTFAGVFEGLPILANYHKDKKQSRIKHFQKHIAPTLRDWFTSAKKETISIAHPSPPQHVTIDSTELSSISFCEGKVIEEEPQEPNHLYCFNETKKHLKEYPPIINPWKEALDDAKTFDKKVKELLSKMNNSLKIIFDEEEFIQLDKEPTELKPNMKFWIPWETTWALYNLLRENNPFRVSRYGRNSQAFEAGRGVSCFVSFVRSEIDDMIHKIYQLSLQSKNQIDEINELRNSVKRNLDIFREEKDKLVKYIEADKQIKGKCELCP